MMRPLGFLTILLCTALIPAAYAADCPGDARTAMLDVAHPVPMRQDVTTEMSGQTIKSAALSTPERRGMSLDASDNPVSMWDEKGRFFTSTDGGKTWSLLRTQSEEELATQAANLKKQADEAVDIACEYGIDLDGKSVHQFSLSYVMIPSGTQVQSTYWVDTENGFPWKVVHAFGGANPSTITQLNAPQPGLEIPVPASQ